MAKRKRLTPPQPGFLDGPAPAPEVKSWPARPPIAQVAGDSAATAALGELAAELESARAEGRLARLLALEEVDESHLVRDRLAVEGDALDELVASLRARGQRTPIEVVDKGEGEAPRYGLISGWRRLSALRILAAEDAAFARVAAIVRAPETASEAYLSMVEENEIRLGLSYYERARIVVKALEQGVYRDKGTALRTLFGNVSRAKRSKIGTFMEVVEALDGSLRFPASIGERFGLALARHLHRPGVADTLRAALAETPPASADAEFDILVTVLDGAVPAPQAEGDAEPAVAQSPAPEPAPFRSDTPPAPDTADAPPLPRPAVTAELSGDRLTLTGPGVDADLLAALDTWLRRRGHPAA
jgi:ParB-like chromosome segregation protein Spo0J